MSHPGPIYRPAGKTKTRSCRCCWRTTASALERDLDRKVIAGINDQTTLNGSGSRFSLAAFEQAWATSGNFAVVAG